MSFSDTDVLFLKDLRAMRAPDEQPFTISTVPDAVELIKALPPVVQTKHLWQVARYDLDVLCDRSDLKRDLLPFAYHSLEEALRCEGMLIEREREAATPSPPTRWNS
jgi:hypothetical protein